MKRPSLHRTRRQRYVAPNRRAKLAMNSDRVADVSRDVLSVDAMREFVERGRTQQAVDQLTQRDPDGTSGSKLERSPVAEG